MIGALEQINEIGWFFAILSVVLVAMIVVGAIKLWKDFKSNVGLKTVAELEKEQAKQDMQKLKQDIKDLRKDFEDYKKDKNTQYDKYHQESIDIRDSLKDDVKYLVEKLDKYVEIDNRRTVATLRTSLWRLHKDFVAQGYVTPDGLKTWVEMGKVYEESGGNDIFHEKLDPEVHALPIRYPEGGVYHTD